MPLKALVTRLRARLSGRSDTEHEQAIVRLLLGAALILYLPLLAHHGNNPGGETGLLSLAALGLGCFIALAAAMFGWILILPAPSPVRRITASVLDIGTTTAFMYYLGEYGVPLYIIYLWTIIGNGFRYGKPYLYNSLVLSIVGFGFVLLASDYWRSTGCPASV